MGFAHLAGDVAAEPPRVDIMGPSSVAHVGQQVGRLRDIVAVFARHGLGDVVDKLHLSGAGAARRFRTRPAAAPTTRAARFRLALEELGPTFVKFGQALSIHSDLLPAGLIAELARLQDAVPALPDGVAEAAIERELGRPIAALFTRFDPKPIGSASIAQVHLATLPDGRAVAVKVRRPGIHAVIESDLAILEYLARAAERHWADADLYAPGDLVRQFARSIRHEQDLAREGRLIERFARNFDGDPTVALPGVHWQWSTDAVLTLDYLSGVKLSEIRGEAASGLDPAIVARRSADAILKQVLVHGLFHADPHPGNVLVLPGNVIGLLDFGIVGHLGRPTRERLASLVGAVARQDVPSVVSDVLAIGKPRIEPDIRALEQDATDLLDSYAGARLQDLSIAEVWRDLADVVSRHRLKLPSDFMLLVKALVTMEGVGRQLDPSFRMIEHAAPFVKELLAERWQPREAATRLSLAGREMAHLVGALPRDLSDVVARARAGQLQLTVRQPELASLAGTLARSARGTGATLIAAALIVGAALVFGPELRSALPRLLPWGAPIVAAIAFLLWRAARPHDAQPRP